MRNNFNCIAIFYLTKYLMIPKSLLQRDQIIKDVVLRILFLLNTLGLNTRILINMFLGENPSGDWNIVVSDRPEEAANPASENADDVETLEENVINAQMKGKQEKWAKMRKQVGGVVFPHMQS